MVVGNDGWFQTTDFRVIVACNMVGWYVSLERQLVFHQDWSASTKTGRISLIFLSSPSRWSNGPPIYPDRRTSLGHNLNTSRVVVSPVVSITINNEQVLLIERTLVSARFSNIAMRQNRTGFAKINNRAHCRKNCEIQEYEIHAKIDRRILNMEHDK